MTFAFKQRILFVKDRTVPSLMLKGQGIEIGAIDRPLPLPPNASAYNLDRLSLRFLEEKYPERKGKLAKVHIVREGADLQCVRNRNSDFIAANHLIEHLDNPTAALVSWVSKLKQDGLLFCAVPDKRWTFDRHRVETCIPHIFCDFYRTEPQRERDDISHIEELLRAFRSEGTQEHQRTDREISEQASRLHQIRDVRVHYHTWTMNSLVRWLTYLCIFLLPCRILRVYSCPDLVENVFLLQVTSRWCFWRLRYLLLVAFTPSHYSEFAGIAMKFFSMLYWPKPILK